jgi:cellulose synthase/poly-beta-1,6-N-acetylglucosamine synthase-like glycosyltransferase
MLFAGAGESAAGWMPSGLAGSGQRAASAVARTAAPEPSELSYWQPIFRQLGVGARTASRIARRARENRTGIHDELVAAGLAEEAAVYRAMAAGLRLGFIERVDPASSCAGGTAAEALLGLGRRSKIALMRGEGGACLHLLAPDGLGLKALRRLLALNPSIGERIRIVAPGELRRAVIAEATPRLRESARDGLFVRRPDLSARIVANAWQGFALGVIALGLPVALVWAPAATTLAAHIAFSLFFCACAILRVLASFHARPPEVVLPPLPRVEELPVYTVLVALRRETEVVPDLLVALGKLVWPRSKLEIKLVCEADDLETLAAIRAQQLRSWVEVIEVPAGMPRTKPNALAYALPMTSGELVVLYDAEDRPHPLQLVEAWDRFRDGGADLACLQAPIRVPNGYAGLLPRAFAFEYAALFRGLLPWLASKHLMFPLGGTSNHFRRAALEHAGAWDPYNVTEDADLGLRLARYGYRAETISLPTREDAPESFAVWLPQRTRWFKGWLQTWLVHMRRPRVLLRDVGWRSFLLTQVLFLGMIVSALVHPILLASGAAFVAKWALFGELSRGESVLVGLDAANILLGYSGFLLLGWRTLRAHERAEFWKVVMFTPVYWMMMSVAAWRAVLQLRSQPHLWEKTEHKRSRPEPVQSNRPPAAASPAAPPFSAAARKSGPEPMILGSSPPIAARSRPA